MHKVENVTNRKRLALHAEILRGKSKVYKADHVKNTLSDRLSLAWL